MPSPRPARSEASSKLGSRCVREPKGEGGSRSKPGEGVFLALTTPITLPLLMLKCHFLCLFVAIPLTILRLLSRKKRSVLPPHAPLADRFQNRAAIGTRQAFQLLPGESGELLGSPPSV